MHIKFLIDKINSYGGGSNQDIRILAQLLVERGHDVTVITVESELNNYPDSEPYTIIESETPELPTRLGRAITTCNLLRRHSEGADIFHIFSPSYHAGGGLYRKLGGKTPVIGYLGRYSFCTNLSRMDGHCHRRCTARAKFSHSSAEWSARLARYPLYVYSTHIEPSLFNSIDRFISISPHVSEIYEAIGIDSDRMEVIPLCYNSDFVNGEINSAAESDKLRVLHVGRLHEMKGVDILLEAVSLTDCDLQVDIVGDGPIESQLQKKAEELGLGNQVEFHGYVLNERLYPFYRDADVFVHPCRFPEPFGRTILEALQTGTPPIVSNIGAPQWIIGDAGYTFDSDNPAELSSTLQRLATDRSELRELRQNCRKRLADFSPEKVGNHMEGLYNDSVGTRPGVGGP